MKRREDMVLPQLPSSSARRPGTKRSKNQRDASLPPLPEEILIEIFTRLPTKTVGHFRCLSRSWAGVLSSSASFVDLHHQQANNNQQQAGLPPNLFFTTAQRCLHACRWRHNDGPPVLHPLTGGAALSLLPQLDRDRALRVLTPKPCHGLVLLHRWPWHGHYVCNPSAGALSPLPDSKMPSRMCDRYNRLPNTVVNCVSYGLGYDPAAKEHKVVRLFYLEGTRSAAAVTACEVFSIGERQACAHWRPAAQRAPSCTVRPWTPAMFFSGRLHFLQEEPGSCIVTFDVRDETFGSLMPPSGLDNVTFDLTVLDGCLCLHYGDGDDVQDANSFYIWRLRSYDDGARQWEQLCCIRRQSWPEALLHLDRISPLEIYRGCNGHKKILFATSALTVFAVDVDVDGGAAPEILLSPPTGDAVVDSFIETNSGSHDAMYNFIESNCGSHPTVGLLEESLVPVGRGSEDIVFSSPSTKAWSDVLKWLPARSVVPLRGVCKDWRAVIKSERFMHLHAIQANMAGKKSPKITLIDPLSGLFSTLPRQWKELHPRNTVGYLFCARLGCRVVCSKPCRGLVVGSYTSKQTSFDFICNPTMGYYKQMHLDRDGGDATFLAGRIGLGYDSRMNKHVRVRLVYHERNMDTRKYQLGCYVHLTDTETAWRPISPPPRPVAEMQPVFVEGKLYWMVDPNLASSPAPGSGCEMLALDVGTEEFEVLQGPRCSYDDITSIVELDGKVCVVCSDRGANALDIWTLEAGGVWAIGRRVELGEFSHEYSSEETAPMVVDPTDGRLLLSTGRALGYYSPTTRTVETIHRLVDQDGMKFSPLLSEESLICPYIRYEKATYSVGM